MKYDWMDDYEPHERLMFFMAAELAGDEDDDRTEELSKALGYTHSTTLNRWLDGRSKIPLKHLTGIAKFFNQDVLDLLPLWVMQDQPEDSGLYFAARRIPTSSEFPLINVARNIYLNTLAFLDDDLDDEDEDYDDIEDDDED
jgi:hypothetical protein